MLGLFTPWYEAVWTDRVVLQTPTSVLPRFQARGLHQIPQLQHDSFFQRNGVPEFMSPEAYDFAWTQYQTLLVDKLNLLTNGKPHFPWFPTRYSPFSLGQ